MATFSFIATNVHGVRLAWYFDCETQAIFARGHCDAATHAVNASPLWTVNGCPKDDLITDATEFAAWLVGKN